jgi:hypothetical protein
VRLEILERVLRHLEIGRHQEVRIGSDPIGERDRLISAVVEREQELDILVADVLDKSDVCYSVIGVLRASE